MEAKSKNFSLEEYLEIKKQALLDRETCESEIAKDAGNIDVMLDAFSSSYEGEARLIYRASFLMPSDEEFINYYRAHGKSATACVDHYKGSELGDILTKVMLLEKYEVRDQEYEMDETEMLDLDAEEETVTPKKDIEDSEEEYRDENVSFFRPIEHLDMETREQEAHEMFSPLARIKKNEVEKQTEEALEKINYLFKKQDTKQQRISTLEKENEEKTEQIKSLEKEAVIREGKISALEAEIERLRKQLIDADEKFVGVNEEKRKLETENKALRLQSERIIAAIDEKFGQYEESNDKRR